MKPLKYSVAALAILATASFTQSAHAVAPVGSLILGIEDTDGSVANSYEVNLGLFNTLTNGETFNLGTSVASFFSSDSNATLEFNIATTGGSAGGGGLASKEVAFTAQSLPTLSGNNTTPNTNIGAFVNNYLSSSSITLGSTTSSNGTAISAGSVSNSQTGSFYYEFDPNGAFTGGQFNYSDGTLGDTFPTTDLQTLYTVTNGSTSAVAVGTFSLSNVGGNEILTFDTLATPEPSAYALGLCAVALFFVLRRRSTVA